MFTMTMLWAYLMLSQFLIMATEPLLAPIRRMLPQTGMVDFSPLILMLILGAVLTVVRV